MRLFVGLELPEDIRRQLGELRRGIPGARWLDPDQLHMTLAFIGDTDANSACNITDSLFALHPPAFELEISGVGHFGSLRRARTVWAGVVTSEPLTRLRKGVVRRLALADVAVERRRFHPHVTLARIRGETGHHLANFLAEHSLMRLPAFPVAAFTLFESRLRPEGAAYEALETFPFERASGSQALA